MRIKKASCAKITLAALVVSAQLFAAAGARATSVTDYAGLAEKYDNCIKRLNGQKNVLRPSLEYVRSALAKFDDRQAKLTRRAANLRGAAARAQGRLNNNELDVCTVTFRGREISISDAYSIANDAEKKAKLCAQYKNEAVTDERTLSVRMKEIDRIAAELAEWKRENDDAVTDAMMIAIEQVTGKFAAHLSKESASLKRLRDAVKHREKSLANAMKMQDVKSYDAVMAKLDAALEKYTVAWTKANTGFALKKAEPVTLWKAFQSETSIITREQAEVNKEVRALLDDPAYSRYVQEDQQAKKELLDLFSQKGAEAAFGAMKGTAKLVPYVGIAMLIRDTSYTGIKWWNSLDQVMMRVDLTDKSFNATKSLVTLIDKRKPKWNSVLEE